MQSDHGHDTPSTGGNDGDEAVWLDLVARLEEPGDSFMDSPPGSGTSDGAAPVEGAGRGDGRAAQGVDDFDPLGVWRQQSAAAPEEADYTRATGAGGSAATGPRDYDDEDLDEVFVPEDLPSLAGANPAIMLSWIGAAGGPIFLVLAAIFWRGMPLVGVIGVIAAFLAGTGYLIYRLPNNRDHDSGDGAVV